MPIWWHILTINFHSFFLRILQPLLPRKYSSMKWHATPRKYSLCPFRLDLRPQHTCGFTRVSPQITNPVECQLHQRRTAALFFVKNTALNHSHGNTSYKAILKLSWGEGFRPSIKIEMKKSLGDTMKKKEKNEPPKKQNNVRLPRTPFNKVSNYTPYTCRMADKTTRLGTRRVVSSRTRMLTEHLPRHLVMIHLDSSFTFQIMQYSLIQHPPNTFCIQYSNWVALKGLTTVHLRLLDSTRPSFRQDIQDTGYLIWSV